MIKHALTGCATLSLCFCLIAPVLGCKESPAPGFTIQTNERIASADNPPILGPKTPIPNVYVNGTYLQDAQGIQPQGTVISYGGTTTIDANGDANYVVSQAKAPAYWNQFVTFDFPCGNLDLYSYNQYTGEYTYLSPNTLMAQNEIFEQDCLNVELPAASKRFAIAGQFPQTLTLTSQAHLTTQNGMPILSVIGKSGVVATETATSVSSDGTQATFAFPPSLAQGGYSLAISNQTPSGARGASVNLLSIAQNTTMSGNPFGVSVGAQTYTLLDANTCTRSKTTSSSYSTFPVISLYSNNQVNVGGTTITVGTNPTAVAAYQANPVTFNSTYGCDSIKTTYSGTTRAIVANSGGNTVSILDIVNNKLVSTITVGTRPVALAVASDGSYAYVANYATSSITRVDLKALTPSAPVAVPGNPTSVALSSSGTLWVGGAGFLTEINTSTMSVVGSESASGKTIIALGYSDQENEVIATSVDTNSNVDQDEISVASFQSGGSYLPMASHQVSALGTYTNPITNAQVRAFTSTLASSSQISPNQVGAPPLVVQDQWAVVTATPTGFIITDASRHQVLVSETTPSPVTAIAVDANLNVAYLTMPDSNILLTVPLPGIN
jgi:YVTN family beta-propeller protein